MFSKILSKKHYFYIFLITKYFQVINQSSLLNFKRYKSLAFWVIFLFNFNSLSFTKFDFINLDLFLFLESSYFKVLFTRLWSILISVVIINF